MEQTKKKILIYGGSFSPPHVGHASSVETVARLFPCDEIWIMPSADRRDKAITASAEHRLVMLQIMISELLSGVKVPIRLSRMEVDRPKLTTTYDTMRELAKDYPDHEFNFLVGPDVLAEIRDKWMNGQEVYRLAHWVVIARPNVRLPVGLPQNFTYIDQADSWISISSTAIRDLIARGAKTAPYTGAGVAGYIEANGLYQPK